VTRSFGHRGVPQLIAVASEEWNSVEHSLLRLPQREKGCTRNGDISQSFCPLSLDRCREATLEPCQPVGDITRSAVNCALWNEVGSFNCRHGRKARCDFSSKGVEIRAHGWRQRFHRELRLDSVRIREIFNLELVALKDSLDTRLDHCC
jgi:hypothetical protein